MLFDLSISLVRMHSHTCLNVTAYGKDRMKIKYKNIRYLYSLENSCSFNNMSKDNMLAIKPIEIIAI